MATNHFNTAVIGAGPGGYVAALKAAQLGLSVAIVEKHYLGGTCLNYGCIPSKALLASAELMHHVQHAADMGIDVPAAATVNWPKIQSRKDRILQSQRAGIAALLKARKVVLFNGLGKLDGAGRVVVTNDAGGVERLTADNIILAVGSVPARIPGWPTDARLVCTSDEALHWKDLPERLLIVGGGVIGCEFACMMQPLGVQVTVVEMMPQLLPFMDPHVAETLTRVFSSRGIAIRTGARIDALEVKGGNVVATLADGATIEVDRVLVATGRRPNTASIGLESVGIETDRGFVRVNDRMQTSARGIYCIGDANGRCLLAHAASAHGIVAAENVSGVGHEFHAPVPNAVYTFPEVASVGMTVEEARSKGMPVTVGQFPLKFLGKAQAAGDVEGFVKVIRSRADDALLGVHMIGHNVTECIAAAGALLHEKASVRDVAEVVFAHPTISESIKEAAEDALYAGLHQSPRRVLRVAAGIA